WQYTIEQLINTISHEIGHTFGLKHVRTNGPDYPSSFANLESWLSTSPVAPDPPGLPVQSNSPIPPTIPSNIPEVMSYDSPNSIFEDKELPITVFNNIDRDGDGTPELKWEGKDRYPKWKNVIIETQNSYRYLGYVLGRRFPDLIANVADRTAIMQEEDRNAVYLYSLNPHRTFQGVFNESDRNLIKSATETEIRGKITQHPEIVNRLDLNTDGDYGRGNSGKAEIDYLGDYDVFLHTIPQSHTSVNIKIKPTASSDLDPVVLVYDEAGKTLYGYLEANNGEINGNAAFGIYLKINSAGQQVISDRVIKIVVGAKDNNSTGEYTLEFK
ncbi:MAG: hypothetical protein KDD63_01905, partial [Bacteroidetes bacterium]|nr:hypothetical protein [Bacteroidota bacterium]